jgi:hypothetical protein
MGRALSLLLLAFLLPKALGQSVNCDATDLLYDFSAPGSLTQATVAGQPYYVANLAWLAKVRTSALRPPTRRGT